MYIFQQGRKYFQEKERKERDEMKERTNKQNKVIFISPVVGKQKGVNERLEYDKLLTAQPREQHKLQTPLN